MKEMIDSRENKKLKGNGNTWLIFEKYHNNGATQY